VMVIDLTMGSHCAMVWILPRLAQAVYACRLICTHFSRTMMGTLLTELGWMVRTLISRHIERATKDFSTVFQLLYVPSSKFESLSV
jgi:hypothetical protein